MKFGIYPVILFVFTGIMIGILLSKALNSKAEMTAHQFDSMRIERLKKVCKIPDEYT